MPDLPIYANRDTVVRTIISETYVEIPEKTEPDSAMPGDNGDQILIIGQGYLGGSAANNNGFRIRMRHGADYGSSSELLFTEHRTEPRRTGLDTGQNVQLMQTFTKTAGFSTFFEWRTFTGRQAHFGFGTTHYWNLTQMVVGDYLYNDDPISLGGTVWQKGATVTIPAEHDGDNWSVWIANNWLINSVTDDVQCRLVVNEGGGPVVLTDFSIEGEDTNEVWSIGQMFPLQGISANAEVYLEVQSSEGSSTCERTTLFLYRMNASTNHWIQYDATALTIDVIDTEYEMARIDDVTPAAAGEVIIACCGVHEPRANSKALEGPALSYNKDNAGDVIVPSPAVAPVPAWPPNGGVDFLPLCRQGLETWDSGAPAVFDAWWSVTERVDVSPTSIITDRGAWVFTLAIGTPKVGKATDLRWQVAQLVGDGADLRWHVANQIADAISLDWNVAELIGDGGDLRWHVAQLIGDGADLRWHVAELIGDGADLRWAVAAVAGKPVDLRWDIAAPAASRAIDIRWRVAKTIGDSVALEWNVFKRLGGNVGLDWNIFAIVGDDIDLRWNAAATAGRAARLDWNIAKIVADALDLRWDLAEIASGAVDLRWSISSDAAAKALALRWNIAERTGGDLSLAWSVLNQVARAVDLVWSVRERIGISADIRWQLFNAIGSQLALNWDLLNTAGASVDLRWKTLQIVEGRTELLWSVFGMAAEVAELQMLVIPDVDSMLAVPDDGHILTITEDATMITVTLKRPPT